MVKRTRNDFDIGVRPDFKPVKYRRLRNPDPKPETSLKQEPKMNVVTAMTDNRLLKDFLIQNMKKSFLNINAAEMKNLQIPGTVIVNSHRHSFP